MSGGQEPNEKYYRQIAKEIRELASTAQLPEVRRELLELAERFERMAAWVARRRSNEHGTPPARGERNSD